jgi:hypothetical protein
MLVLNTIFFWLRLERLDAFRTGENLLVRLAGVLLEWEILMDTAISRLNEYGHDHSIALEMSYSRFWLFIFCGGSYLTKKIFCGSSSEPHCFDTLV